jgi:hypothetical protein
VKSGFGQRGAQMAHLSFLSSESRLSHQRHPLHDRPWTP